MGFELGPKFHSLLHQNVDFCPFKIVVYTSMKLLGLPTTKHFFSFILGCPQDFNFAWPFWFDWFEWAKWPGKIKVLRHKSFIENCHKKINS